MLALFQRLSKCDVPKLCTMKTFMKGCTSMPISVTLLEFQGRSVGGMVKLKDVLCQDELKGYLLQATDACAMQGVLIK